jgi:perosamine synthetase
MKSIGIKSASPRSSLEAIHSFFKFMKENHSLDDVATKSLAVKIDGNPAGYLQPLSWKHLGDEVTINKLTQWRQSHEYAYPSRSNITPDSTLNWLESSVLLNDKRLLFLVTDMFLRPIGHLGLLVRNDGLTEVDNVLRGEPAPPRTMELAMRSLETWCLSELDIQILQLRVLQSNGHAIDFYTRQGYTLIDEVNLAWVNENGSQFLRPTVSDTPDDVFLEMVKGLQDSGQPETKILTAGPLIGVREANYVLDATRSGWNNQHSEYLQTFESDFASYIGVASALATSSCTGALHLALLALGIGPGDEVIVPETTWVATGAAVAYVGAVPVFADIDPVTWTITPESVQAVMTERTRAILPVHLYGFPADMPKLMAFASEHDLLVLEDAAPAIGALVDGKAAGSFGHMGAFSFQGAKMLVTGEGGMLVTNDQVLRDKAWKQQDHGRKPGTFWIDEIGRKYKMSNVTAALGLAQLQSVETQIAKKRRINDWYREFLLDTPGLSFQTELPSSRSICWMTSITLEEGLPDRDDLATQLMEQGIDTRPVFPPISTYPIWSKSQETPGANAAWVGARGLNLPSGVSLSRASVERVAEAIDSVVRSA